MSNFERSRNPKGNFDIGTHNEFKKWLKKHIEAQFVANGEWRESDKGIIHIININSDSTPDHEVTDYLEEVILEYPTSIPFKDLYRAGCCSGVSYLINHVPVFLVEEQTFLQYNDDAHSDTFEYMGWYSRTGNEKEIPSIFICYDRITGHTEKKINQKYLFAAVAIHEFAHALMDCGIEPLKQKTQSNGPLFEWVEESLANLITLQIAKKSKLPGLFDNIKDFVIKQKDNYKFGKDLFDVYPDDYFIWMNWWNMKETGRMFIDRADAEGIKDAEKFREVLVKYGRGFKGV
ncbi:MAG: hypothetical protein JXK95_13335 [Bacteroidales bacterium]|nr:hypothetical protein [Bacteroidales bacterium]